MFYSKRIAQFSDYQNILALINDGKRQMTAAGITNTSNIPIKNLVTSLNFIPCRKYEMAGREQFGTFIEYVYPISNCK